ncbi:uridine phosphorylase, partial [Vibrio parahaemolyticus]|nr:uridine phosphorylase [Vibrio parahaemolyticus]
MSQAVFHLGVTEADLNGATLAIIPGDPARVQKIAEQMENPVFLAS